MLTRWRFIGVVAAAILTTSLSSPGKSADLMDLPVGVDWTGAYFGATAGYGTGESRWNIPQLIGPPTTTGDFDVDGWLVGGTVGHNWQNGDWVYGVEGDLSASDISGRDTDVGPSVNCAGLCETRLSNLLTVRGRIGMDFDGLLAYVTGGYAGGKVVANNGPSFFGQDWANGWTAGAGLEKRFNQRVSAKIEYLYVDLSTITASPSPARVSFPELHVIRAGFNVHF